MKQLYPKVKNNNITTIFQPKIASLSSIAKASSTQFKKLNLKRYMNLASFNKNQQNNQNKMNHQNKQLQSKFFQNQISLTTFNSQKRNVLKNQQNQLENPIFEKRNFNQQNTSNYQQVEKIIT